jgi:general secretion pathway protein C
MKIANAHAGTNTWTLRTFTFLVWVAVGLCAAYWAFKFVTTKPVEATAASATPAVVVDTKAVAKLLGATDNVAAKPVITAPSVKLTLFGLATTRSGHGVALIATEDKPAKPYRVGAKVTDDLVLKSISKVDAVLATSTEAPDGPKLELPLRKPATFVASSAPSAGSQMAGSARQASALNYPPSQPPNQQPPSAAAAVAAATGAAAAGAGTNEPPGPPNFANTAGNLKAIQAEATRPISRFAPRADGSANQQVPAMPSTINPAAAASSAVSPAADGAARN